MTASLQTAQRGGVEAVNTAGGHEQSWNKCASSQTGLKETSGASLGRHWQSQIKRKGTTLLASPAPSNLISLPQALPRFYWD